MARPPADKIAAPEEAPADRITPALDLHADPLTVPARGRRHLLAGLGALALLAACSRGGENKGGGLRMLNPFNWFGRSREEVNATPQVYRDPRELVDEVVDLKVERTSSGAIIRAVGLPAVIGVYDAELVPLKDEEARPGVLRYEFRLMPPKDGGMPGPKRARLVHVARYLPNPLLEGVRRIEVIGRKNRRITRR